MGAIEWLEYYGRGLAHLTATYRTGVTQGQYFHEFESLKSRRLLRRPHLVLEQICPLRVAPNVNTNAKSPPTMWSPARTGLYVSRKAMTTKPILHESASNGAGDPQQPG